MKKDKTMMAPVMVRYVGLAGRRIVEQYEWNAQNNFIQEVTDQALLETLRADGEFEIMTVKLTTTEQEGE
jgi:hypothetical protein